MRLTVYALLRYSEIAFSAWSSAGHLVETMAAETREAIFSTYI